MGVCAGERRKVERGLVESEKVLCSGGGSREGRGERKRGRGRGREEGRGEGGKKGRARTTFDTGDESRKE